MLPINKKTSRQAAGFFRCEDCSLQGSVPRTGWQEYPGVAASENFAMPNLRSFNLLQRLPVVSIGPIRWLAGRDHRNPERNVYPSPDCRYASGCTLPDNLPVIPCACRAGMRLVLLVTGVDSAELRRDQLGSCPGSFSTERREVPLHSSLRRCADTAGQLHFSFVCGLLRVPPDLRKPDTADSANAHHSHRETYY